MWRRVVLAVLVGTLVLAVPSTAGAHAEIVRASPGINEFVSADVSTLRITFTPLIRDSPTEIEVTAPSGDSVVAGPVTRLDQGTLEVPIELTELGIHSVEYTVVGLDLDLTEGLYQFTVRESDDEGFPVILLVAAGFAGLAGVLLFLWWRSS